MFSSAVEIFCKELKQEGQIIFTSEVKQFPQEGQIRGRKKSKNALTDLVIPLQHSGSFS